MRPDAVHQFIPVLAPNDAVGQHTLKLRDLLRDMGLESDIYTTDLHAGFDIEVKDPGSFAPPPGRRPVVLYQASTGSELSEFVLRRPEPLVLDYHNITPASFFRAWEPSVAPILAEARRQLSELVPGTVLGFADSQFNADELALLGCQRTVVAPILFDRSTFDVPADPALAARLSSGSGSRWLFVGRIAPNKAQHDIIRSFAVYRQVVDPEARLALVGGDSSDRYLRALHSFVDELGLGAAVELPGSVSAADLAAHYEAADVFVCLSEHEGFCVPLLEAMHHGVPIVAFASSAVPETLGGGGLVLPEKSPALIAAAVARVVSDASVRESLVAAGRRRLEDFDIDRTRAIFTAAFDSLLDDLSS